MKSEKKNLRREFIKKSILASASLAALPAFSFGNDGQIKPIAQGNNQTLPSLEGVKTVAFICHAYYRRSHADVIGTKLFVGIPLDDGMKALDLKVVSMFIEQVKDEDIGVRIAKMNGVPLYPTITEALTLGGDQLAVDAVIYVGEHGDFPYNRLGQKLYPRMNTLETIFRVFDASKKSVPVYCDKALSYSWLDCKWIYDRAKELNVPMMSGSSLPYAYRKSGLEHPIGAKITEAVAVGYGTLDGYGHHVTEILQCMLERRAGGETGVESVEAIQGNAVWDAMDAGKISWELANAAVDTITYKAPGNLRDLVKNPSGVMVKYKDGTKGAILILTGTTLKTRTDGLPPRSGSFAYAAKADGKTVSTEFVLDIGLRSTHFSYLIYNVEKFILSGIPQAPIERNLLTSGIIDMGIRSLHEGKLKKTPFLDIKYAVAAYKPFRSPNPQPTNFVPWPPKGYEFLGWR